MAFDLSTAKPIDGFDISTAKPVGENSPPDPNESSFNNPNPSLLSQADTYLSQSPIYSGAKKFAQFEKEQVMNAPQSALNFGKGIAQTVMHPIETVKGVRDIVQGATGTGNEQDNQKWDSVKEFFKQRYGGIDNLTNTIKTDPVGFAADLSAVLGVAGGTVGKIGEMGDLSKVAEVGNAISKVGNTVDPLLTAGRVIKPIAKELTSSGLGILTGTQGDVIKEAMNPTKDYWDALRKKVSPEDIVNKAEDAFQNIKNTRSSEYQDKLAQISKNTTPIDITPIKEEMNNLLDKFNIKKGIDPETGQINYDFSRSVLGKTATNDVQSIINDVENWGSKVGDNTASGLDILKRRVGDFWSPSSEARAFVQGIKSKVKSEIVKNVPEYEGMVKGYEDASDLLKDLKTLSIGKGANTDMVFRKVQQSLRQNFEVRKQLVGELEKNGATGLTQNIAGQQLSTFEPRGIAKLGAAGAAYYIIDKLKNPYYLLSLLASSPRLIGETVGGISALGNSIPSGVANSLSKMAFQAGRIQQPNFRNKLEKYRPK